MGRSVARGDRAHAGGKRQIAIGEAASAGKQHIALMKIDAGRADVPSRRGCFRDGDVIAIHRRIFLNDDGVGAVGDHAAGEDARRFTCAHRAAERPPRRDLADHLQPRL